MDTPSREDRTKAKEELKDELRKDLKRSLDAFHALRDEVRVQAHLAGMDAKQRLTRLEEEGERLTREASRATVKAIEEVTRRLREFSASIQKH